MENAYLVIKSLHIIFVVTWFAGLFYIFRLFVYHAEALDKEEVERAILVAQFRKMERLLWNVITAPSAVLTLIFGFSLLYIRAELLYQPFMQFKLGFLVALYLYHLYAWRIVRNLQQDDTSASSNTFRYLNEVATVLLIAIVFLIVMQDTLSWIYGVLGIVGTAVLLTIAIAWYKKRRKG